MERTRKADSLRRKLRTVKRWWFSAVDWAQRNLPPGLRTLIGVLLIVGGVLGFLPVLGFWMLPLGIAVIWVDIKRAYRSIRARIKREE